MNFINASMDMKRRKKKQLNNLGRKKEKQFKISTNNRYEKKQNLRTSLVVDW